MLAVSLLFFGLLESGLCMLLHLRFIRVGALYASASSVYRAGAPWCVCVCVSLSVSVNVRVPRHRSQGGMLEWISLPLNLQDLLSLSLTLSVRATPPVPRAACHGRCCGQSRSVRFSRFVPLPLFQCTQCVPLNASFACMLWHVPLMCVRARVVAHMHAGIRHARASQA
jgi:hypothetical protein